MTRRISSLLRLFVALFLAVAASLAGPVVAAESALTDPLGGQAQPASAELTGTGLIRDIGILRDPSGTMTLAEAQKNAFTPNGKLVIAGFTGASFWVRLTVLPAPHEAPTVLVVRPPTFDQITLYAPDAAAPGHWVAHDLGGRVPVGTEEWASSIRVFALTPKPEGTVYYMRLETTGSFTVYIDAMPKFTAHRQGMMIDFAQITYLSLMLVLMVWSLRMALLTRERMFWWFATMQAGWVFHNLFLFGYVSLVAPDLPQHVVFLTFRSAVIVVSCVGMAFHRTFLRRFDPHWTLIRMMDAMMAVMAAALIIFWIGDQVTALRINGLCVAAAPFVFVAAAFTARTSVSPGLRAIRVIYALLSGSLFLWLLTLLGLFGFGAFALYGAVIHGTATGVLIATILHLHAQNLLADAQQARTVLAGLQQRRAVEEEQKRTLMRFIDMLTHETKNAMAVINMSVSAPQMGERQKSRIAEAIRDLTRVIDRCNQSVQLDNVEQSITLIACDPALILREACMGHPAAERTVLTAPASMDLCSDPVLLRVILTNLIENALKYSPAGSRIDVALAKAPEGRVEITVENDAGPTGMPDPAQVFERYYRSPRALSQIGSGLGLYLVQGLVRVLGGGIAYEPSAGRVRFRLWLPC